MPRATLKAKSNDGLVSLSEAHPDATFEELRTHFTDREIVEITWLNAFQNYTNLVNIPLDIESDGFCAIARSESQMEQDERAPAQIAQE